MVMGHRSRSGSGALWGGFLIGISIGLASFAVLFIGHWLFAL